MKHFSLGVKFSPFLQRAGSIELLHHKSIPTPPIPLSIHVTLKAQVHQPTVKKSALKVLYGLKQLKDSAIPLLRAKYFIKIT